MTPLMFGKGISKIKVNVNYFFLFKACMFGHLGIAELLLKEGANFYAINKHGKQASLLGI